MFFLERSEFNCQKLLNKTPCPDENSVKSVFKQAVEDRADKGNVMWQWRTWEKSQEEKLIDSILI